MMIKEERKSDALVLTLEENLNEVETHKGCDTFQSFHDNEVIPIEEVSPVLTCSRSGTYLLQIL